MNKKNMRCILSGSSKGIGLATAKLLLSHGFSVHGISRSPTKIQDPCFSSSQMDFRKLDLLEQELKFLLKELPFVDCLICNAGMGLFGKLESLSCKQMKECMDCNFLAHAYLIKTFLPAMKLQKKGHIVLIASEAAKEGKSQGSVYCASKFALQGFSQALRQECRSSGIRVSVIYPGMTQSSFFDHLHFEPKQEEGYFLDVEDVARSVYHVLSQEEHCVIEDLYLSPRRHGVSFRTHRS